MSNDFLMYEIAICINALCFDKKKINLYLIKKNQQILLKVIQNKKINLLKKKNL